MAYQPKFAKGGREESRGYGGPAPRGSGRPAPRKSGSRRRGRNRTTWRDVVRRCFAVLLTTVLLLIIGLYGVMYVLAKGPSPTAKTLFVRSVRETSAMYWLADLYFSPEEIAEIENVGQVQELEETDASLITIKVPEKTEGPVTDAWGLRDDDGDGLILEQVRGTGFVGYMMVVLDPSRIMMGTAPVIGARGMTVDEMCREYNCVAGINGGGFKDENGSGDGSMPDGMIVLNGEVMFASTKSSYVFAGFDQDYILRIGNMTPQDVKDKGIQFGCSFGPVLVANGERTDDAILASGVNPRTAIGQRSDGAVLLLVVDGRQAHSLGATYAEMADVMLSYGAVNAFNLDGGSSTVLWHNGGWVNSSASVVGVRPVPTAFLVKEVS